jgi:hypothetical protein
LNANIFNLKKDTPTILTSTKIDNTNKDTLASSVDLGQYIGCFYVVIDATDVEQYIEIAPITLDTLQEYEDMESALTAGGAIGITVSEAPAVAG